MCQHGTPMLTKRILTPFVAGLLLVGVAACGSDEKSSDATTAAATEATSDAAEPAPTDDGTDATEPASDGTTGAGTDAGSEFCVAAENAKTTGDAVNLDTGTPAEVEAGVRASIEAAQAAADVAPEEIKPVVEQILSYQQQFADILDKYDWDLAQAVNAPEFNDLANQDVQGNGDQLDAYLSEHCGLSS